MFLCCQTVQGYIKTQMFLLIGLGLFVGIVFFCGDCLVIEAFLPRPLYMSSSSTTVFIDSSPSSKRTDVMKTSTAVMTVNNIYSNSNVSIDEKIYNNTANDTTATTTTITTSPLPLTKRLLCIRHGISIANEHMKQPGNQWGDSTFHDDNTMVDARLSETGKMKTRQHLQQQLMNEPDLREFLSNVELILISPLTRCLETYTHGVEPILKSQISNFAEQIPVMAVPLLRERVYTSSDTGRSYTILEKEFPTISFDECRHDCWWYTGQNDDENETYIEWRPYGQGQHYAVPGETISIFDQRMKELDIWLSQRNESNILVVSHWGVLRHFTNGVEWDNAEAKIINWSYCPISNQRQSTISMNK